MAGGMPPAVRSDQAPDLPITTLSGDTASNSTCALPSAIRLPLAGRVNCGTTPE